MAESSTFIKKYKDDENHKYFKHQNIKSIKHQFYTTDLGEKKPFKPLGLSKYVFYGITALGAIALILVFYLILKNIAFRKKNQTLGTDEIEELIQSSEETLESLVLKAMEVGNYSAAVRYKFILLLQYLDSYKLIKFEKSKTNYDYQNEIESLKVKQSFNAGIKIFNLVNYGNFEADKSIYEDFTSNLDLIKELISDNLINNQRSIK